MTAVIIWLLFMAAVPACFCAVCAIVPDPLDNSGRI